MTQSIKAIVRAVGILALPLLLGSCSELKKDLPSPVSARLTVHDKGWGNKTSPNFHGKYLGTTTPTAYNESLCQRCHAVTFAGGTSGVSCTRSGCHVDINGKPKSLQACNTCHGTFNAPDTLADSWPPPRGLNGDTLNTSFHVGAHHTHIETLGAAVACRECHTVPMSVSDPGHITGLAPFRAHVLFNGPLANYVSGNGTSVPHPAYDPVQYQCSSVFCHGTWRLVKDTTKPEPYTSFYTDSVMVGNGFSPVWTGAASQDSCGSCHGIPPVGHRMFDITACHFCHGDVVDATGNIIDDSKHIDGKIQVYTVEYPFR